LEISMKWKGGMKFGGVSQFGHPIETDVSLQSGGEESGYRPIELLLFGLAGCTGFDVISIGQKMRLNITALEINIKAEQREEPPKAISKAHIEYIVSGEKIDPEKLERVIELSEEKYCSVGATLSGVTRITHSYTIKEE